jgi:hypothetical protein
LALRTYYAVRIGDYGPRTLKTLVTFRLDPELLARVRQMAAIENRTLTNFVETVLKRSIDNPNRLTDGAPAQTDGRSS